MMPIPFSPHFVVQCQALAAEGTGTGWGLWPVGTSPVDVPGWRRDPLDQSRIRPLHLTVCCTRLQNRDCAFWVPGSCSEDDSWEEMHKQ